MQEPAEVLAYLAHVSKLGDICDIPPIGAMQSWTVSIDEFRDGGLSSHMTREILLAYSNRYPEIPFGSIGIPMVCCLRSLTFNNETPEAPLLLMGVTLDPNGSLAPHHAYGAWIPRTALDTHELYNKGVVVGDLDTYRAHQVAMESLPEDGSWGAALSRAEDLFASVYALSDDTLDSLGAHLNIKTCTLSFWERPEELSQTSKILEGLVHEVDEGAESKYCEASLAFLRLMIDEDKLPKDENVASEQLPDEALLSPKLLCGIPDHLPALGQREHEALATFEQQQRGDVLAVQAPSGTNYATFVIALMANLLTNSALRGDPAPHMCCVAPAHVLEQLVGLMSERPIVGQVALGSRWLPRISQRQGANATSLEKRILGPLPAMFLAHAADGVRISPSNLCLESTYAHEQGSDLALYREPWYVPKAATYFLDCVSGFTKQRFHSVGQARGRLADLLRRVDQERCELIDAYANVCRASELLKQRDGLVARIGRLRRGHTICKERLAFWQKLAQDNRPRISLMGNAEQDQAELIRSKAQKGETIAEDKTSISQVCEAYTNEILRIETSIDRLRGAASNLNTRIRAAAPEGSLCSKIIERLTELCRLTQEQKAMLDAVIDGRKGEVSLSHLQEALDKTIRPAEFWLAVHIYESCWISFSHKNMDRARARKEDSRDLWNNIPSICPISLIPEQIAVGILAGKEGEPKMTSDVTVVLDAGSMDISRGLAISSVSNRLVVAGSKATLGATATLAKTFDELRCVEQQGQDSWERLISSNMTVSSGRSFYDFVCAKDGMPIVSLCDTHDSYGELDDLRNDLFDMERLHTCRLPANSADDLHYVLRGIVPSLSYVLVPDSAWRRLGASRSNQSEAMALRRWLNNHGREIVDRYGVDCSVSLAIVSPFDAQTKTIRKTLQDMDPSIRQRMDIVTLCNLRNRTYPMVILCATCGPEAFDGMGVTSARHVLGVSAAAACDALVVFCGGAWIRSASKAAISFFAHARRIGRLFSAPRSSNISSSGKDFNDPKAKVNLRSKPLSITALIKLLKERGDIGSEPTATEVNRALLDVGLIERVRLDGGKNGWRPTAAGREVGIVSTKDRNGNPFCAYTVQSEAVVATTIQSMED